MLQLLVELLGLPLMSCQPVPRVLRDQTGTQLSYFIFAITDVALGSALQVGQQARLGFALLGQCVIGVTHPFAQ